MNKVPTRIIFFLFTVGSTGCTSYKVPIQAENHPALFNAKISQIELSPLLDIPVSQNIEEQELNVHFQH